MFKQNWSGSCSAPSCALDAETEEPGIHLPSQVALVSLCLFCPGFVALSTCYVPNVVLFTLITQLPINTSTLPLPHFSPPSALSSSLSNCHSQLP